VKKIYLAHVLDWPPYHRQGLSEGTIDIPLAPSSERIKWEVCPVAKGGKECKTYWRVFEDLDKLSANEGERSAQNATNEKRGTTLELRPITGRTHQLRIHCAAIGSGIVGDSLYGDSPIEWLGDNADANTIQKQEINANSTARNDGISKTLRLHAHKLSFPHPNNGEKVTFESPKPW
jgi:23S rRNA-/tRNA-specific pseudouridylate synthase